jgi:chaperonin GroEL
MEKVGKEGVITVEEAKGSRIRARCRRGHAVRPRLPLALLRHQPDKMTVELENPYILIHEKKLSNAAADAADP